MGRRAVIVRAPVAVLIALVAAAPAMAQDEPGADTEARTLFLDGKGLYDEGRYEEAIAAWERAHALSERPLLLFNLANAYERTGRFDLALERLEQYRPFALPAEQDNLSARILNLGLRLGELQAERAAGDAQRERAEAERDRAEAERRRAEAERLLVQAELEAERQRAEAERLRAEAELEAERRRLAELEAARSRRVPIAPLALGGAGLAAVATGVVFTSGAARAAANLDDSCRDLGEATLCSEAGQTWLARGSRDRALAWTGYGVGAAALVAGSLALALGRPGTSDLRVWTTGHVIGVDVGFR